MRIIILKKVPSRPRWKVGLNHTVRRGTWGKELIKNKLAGEIPHSISGVWHFGGYPSNELAELQKPKWVTIEEYNSVIKRTKEEK